jgi:nicotinamidase-related amidase
VAEHALVVPGQIKIPGPEFLHPGTGRLWAGRCQTGHGPADVPEVAGVTDIAFGTIRGQTHAREEFGTFFFTELVEEQRGHAILAIGCMGLPIHGDMSP